MKKYKNFVEFTRDFSTQDQYYRYLCDLKWKDGYQCRKCGHSVTVKGRTWLLFFIWLIIVGVMVLDFKPTVATTFEWAGIIALASSSILWLYTY